MGRLKSAMMDVGEEAMDIGIEAASTKHHLSKDDVKLCILLACGYPGEWDQFVSEGGMGEVKPQILHQFPYGNRGYTKKD